MNFACNIPSTVRPGVCCQCGQKRTLCADVVFRGKQRPCVLCSACRVASEGQWTVEPDPVRHDEKVPEGDSRARILGRGLKARSPSKHGLPFTF